MAANQPAWLRVRNGRPEIVLHCTQAQELDLCPQKFYYHYGQQIETTGARPALNYGGAAHKALKVRFSSQLPTLDLIEQAQLAILDEWFNERPQPSDEWRNAERCKDLIRAYNEHYPEHDWTVLGVEEEFEIRVGEVTLNDVGETTPCYLAGRKDLIVAWHEGLWVVDHKTCQDWGSGDSNSHLDEGKMSFQFRGYAWAEREAQRTLAPQDVTSAPLRRTLPVLGTVGNYLVSRKPYSRPPANGRPAAPRNEFHQEAFPFTDASLDEWRSEFLAKCEDLLRHELAADWALHRKRGACGHWGRCEFYDVCAAQPGDREALLTSSLFQPRVVETDL